MASKNECEYCGASLSEGERYCKYCGSPNPSYKGPTKNVPQIVKTELPDEYLKVAEKCASILGLDYCGVDILEGPNGEPIVSEVNSNAFYEGIEKTTGVNVAGCYVDY